MTHWREALKRRLPPGVREAVIRVRDSLGPPALERIVLHDYDPLPEDGEQPRLNLIIPTVSPAKAFGGVTTGLEIFLEIGRRIAADLRIVLDDFETSPDLAVVGACARRAGVAMADIEIRPRAEETPRIGVRRNDLFFTFNWWTTLNVRTLLQAQQELFGGERRPYLYAIQEYEPHFYPFSSTHMMARLAYESPSPCWAIFNSSELHAYFEAQGHRVDRAFVFEPRLSDSLRPFLAGPPPAKARRLLVYGRPSVPRNCYPSVEAGLRLWTERYPQFRDWEVVSAGLAHPPVALGRGRSMRSLGKLTLEAYGELLRTTGVGLSLMASPHPSYPPLEMAHFGVRTVTNRYGAKDLSSSHENIISIADVAPESLAAGLAEACERFEAAPEAGWTARSLRPSFLDPSPFGFLDDVAAGLKRVVTATGR